MASFTVMDLKELKSLFGLDGIPWISLLGSTLGLSLLGSWRYGSGHPSESVLWLLTLAGVDGSAAMASVHAWFVNPLRNDTLAAVCGVCLVLAGVAYARCYWRELQSGEDLSSAGRSLGALRESLYRKDSPVTSEQRDSMLKQERKRFDEAARYESELSSWLVARMVRLAEVAWILLAVLAEADRLGLDPIAVFLSAAFVIALAGIGLAKAESGARGFNMLSALFFLALSAVASLAALPVFLVARITSPPSRRAGKSGDRDSGD